MAIAGSKRTFSIMSGAAPDNRRGSHLSQAASRTSSVSDEPALSGAIDDMRTLRPHALGPSSRSFHPESSIVLVGTRGTGKSTLGVFASTALRRRLIDTDYSFQELTGHSSSAYRRLHGSAQHLKRWNEVLGNVLQKHAMHCVIVYSSGSLDRQSHALLREYAETHPVIHVVRDVESIRHYLNISTDKMAGLQEVSGPVFRGCSNFEFFNFPDTPVALSTKEGARLSAGQRPLAPYLALKQAERHFLKFVKSAMGYKNFPSLEDAYPLSQVPTEARKYTYSVSVPLELLADPSLDIEALEFGADVFELCIRARTSLNDQDGNDSSCKESFDLRRADQIGRAFARIRRTVVIPVVYHVDTRSMVPSEQVLDDLSTNVVGKQHYLDLIYYGLRLAPDYITLNLYLSDSTIRKIMQGKGSTKTIAQCQPTEKMDQSWDDEILIQAYERARRLGFDAIRICWYGRRVEDNFGVHTFRSRIDSLGAPRLPTIAFNSGPLGRTSVCFNPTLTSVTHDRIKSTDKRVHAPRITATDATKALFSSFVFEPMKFYILGSATSYSLSPAMHNAAFQLYGMSHVYRPHQSPSLSGLDSLVSDPYFGGSSVSLPFKVEVITLTHSLSKHARAIGAVNTLVPIRELAEDGSIPSEIELFNQRNRSGPVKALYGENTDWHGIRACVRRGLSPVNAVSPRTSALVVGAGGMARAAVYALLQLGVQNIVIFNRTVQNAERIKVHFKSLVGRGSDSARPYETLTHLANATVKIKVLNARDEPWPEDLRQPTIVVSCVPTHRIGDQPSPDFTLPSQWLRSPTGGVVMEVAYRNIHTPLLEQIRAEAHRGWVAMDGLDLLPDQAFAQFELFTGRRAPRRLMRAEVLRNYLDENGKPDPTLIQWRIDQVNEQEI